MNTFCGLKEIALTVMENLQPCLKLQDRDILIEQSPWGKKVYKNVEKKGFTRVRTRDFHTYLTAASLTTEPLLSWLLTLIDICFINESSSTLIL